MPMSHKAKKASFKANTRPCLQCAWAAVLDECRDNLKAQNYERCLEMKDFYSEVWRNVGCRHSALSSCF